jgi:hypothetical protein
MLVSTVGSDPRYQSIPTQSQSIMTLIIIDVDVDETPRECSPLAKIDPLKLVCDSHKDNSIFGHGIIEDDGEWLSRMTFMDTETWIVDDLSLSKLTVHEGRGGGEE